MDAWRVALARRIGRIDIGGAVAPADHQRHRGSDASNDQEASFGLFIRSLVGLDRAAAKAAFAEFLDDKRYSRNQIEFVNLIIDELSSTGVIEARRVYESPYDGLAPEGPEAIFVEADLERLFATIDQIMSTVKVAL
ncbi:MAG TPA: type I restriction-modification enzyme R subunit C-terminal domain-containing protein [Candidatus Methylomirabilis sp.]|nr:type I restriction-modification enzyme R subunit C-terminal domain-containing protein [Candidatus Methylomirabilis sp.]